MKINNLYMVLYKPREIITANLKSFNILIPIVLVAAISSLLYTLYAFQTLDSISIEININSISPLLLLFTLVIGFLIPIMGIVINSIINYIAILITGVYVEFRSLMIIGLFSYIPVIIELLLKILISLLTGDHQLYATLTSLAAFSNNHLLLQSIFSSISITGVWSLLIYVIGVFILIKSNNGRVKKTSMFMVILINIILTIAIAFLTIFSEDTGMLFN